MTLLFNKTNLTSADLDLPRHGCWVADLISHDLEQNPLAVGDAGTLTIDGVSYSGTIVEISALDDFNKIRVIGGSGAMFLPTSAKNLTEVKGSQILSQLLKGTAESLGSVASDINNYSAKEWQLLNDVPRGMQLSRFLERFNKGVNVWRFDNAGTLQVRDDISTQTTQTVPERSALTDILANGTQVYEFEELEDVLEPGKYTDKGYRIEEINVKATASSLEITFITVSLVDALDIITDKLHKNTLQSSYSVTIDSQDGDGNLSVVPDDPRIKGGGMSKLPIRYGTANLKVESIPQGTKATVQFDSSDPEKPYVSGFHVSTAQDAINIFGNTSSAEFVALSEKTDAEIARIWDHLGTTFAVLAQDGGAVLWANQVTAAGLAKTASQSVAASKLKSE